MLSQGVFKAIVSFGFILIDLHLDFYKGVLLNSHVQIKLNWMSALI